MTTAASPEENARQFFANYGKQIRGTGSDVHKFIDGLQGINREGEPEPRWKVYNSVNSNWSDMVRRGVGQMRRDIPIYLSQRTEGRDNR